MLDLPLSELQPGMILALTVKDESGATLIKEGAVLDDVHIAVLTRRGIERVSVMEEIDELDTQSSDLFEREKQQLAALFSRIDVSDPLMIALYSAADAHLTRRYQPKP